MNTHPIHQTTLAALAALGLGLGSASLQAQVPASAAPGTKLEIVTPQSEAFGLSRIAGKPLRAANGEELTTVTDFLIDAKTGQLRFAVAPSGAGTAGETYRIIPAEAFDSSRGADNMSLKIDRSQWDKVGTMTEQELQGRININDEHEQRLAQQFSLSGTPTSGSLELVRASQLKGREIRAGNHTLGTIDDVVIDLNNKVAEPMFASNEFGGTQQKFLVPFSRLEVGEQAQGPINTTLTRADFQQLQPGASPTGYASNAFGQPVMSAATAVRQALDRDPSLRGGVQVVPESRIVLQGSVENEQKKSQIEQAARQAAPGVPIENQLTVRSW